MQTLGNHDFDFGEEILHKLLAKTECDWVLSNAIDTRNGKPLANSFEYLVQDWGGIKVGLIGLLEPGWMETLTCDTSVFKYEGSISLLLLLHGP